MSREIICPHCGRAVPKDEPAWKGLETPSPGVSPTSKPASNGSGSLVVDLQAEPTDSEARADSEPDANRVEGLAPPVGNGKGGSDLAWLQPSDSGESAMIEPRPETFRAGPPEAMFQVDAEISSGGDLLMAPAADPFLEALANAETVADAPSLAEPTAIVPGLDLSAPPAAVEPSGESTGLPTTGEGAIAGPETGRSSLAMVLLSSYASAVTLALVWLLWQGDGRTRTAAPTIPTNSRVAIEASNGAAFVAALPMIPPVRSTTIGRPLRVGDLEITPLAIWSGPVNLNSATGDRRRDGGDDALLVRLRLRNLSESEPFAPLEPGFVREPDQGAPESLIVAGDHPILPYRLAIQSEWRIQGQSFAVLGPGEERETIIVSETDARDKAAPSMTWRLRLRTAPHQTDIIGIGFARDEIEDRWEDWPD